MNKIFLIFRLIATELVSLQLQTIVTGIFDEYNLHSVVHHETYFSFKPIFNSGKEYIQHVYYVISVLIIFIKIRNKIKKVIRLNYL